MVALRLVNKTSILLCVCLVAAFTNFVPAQQRSAGLVAANYEKREVTIQMRDGVKLFTTVFTPRDKSKTYPIMMNRTCYSCQPYGPDQYPGRIAPSAVMEQESYIFVKQDVRGRWMSEGKFDNMRPHVAGDSQIDESSDTYDTIEWLIKNVPSNNGKVGMWGNFLSRILFSGGFARTPSGPDRCLAAGTRGRFLL